MLSVRKSLALALVTSAWLPFNAQAQTLPAHTVLSFNLTACPKGWVPYKAAAGAVVMGYDNAKIKLGGGGPASMDQWVLTAQQIPPISGTVGTWPVSYTIQGGNGAVYWALMQANGTPGITNYTFTVGSGSPQAIPLPKYAGLLFCEMQ